MSSAPGSKVFLGSGVAFAVGTDDKGALLQAAYEDSVEQAVWIILSTAPGERAMRPDFGCGIHDLVFETISASTGGRVAVAVREALLRLEPRIDVRDVGVERSPSDDNVLLINIDYEVRATNNMFNLVYPFYLDGGVAA
jgi:uncharacterized protein